MKLYDIDPGPYCPAIVRAVVEIPKNSSNKYEYDATLGVFRLDRSLYSPVHYPGDYGFIPGTLADDKDPLDVLILLDEPTFTGCLLEARPIGVLHMVDADQKDQKILAVPNRNPRFDTFEGIGDVAPHVRTEIEYFFSIYKELQGVKTQMNGWEEREAAYAIVERSRSAYLEKRR